MSNILTSKCTLPGSGSGSGSGNPIESLGGNTSSRSKANPAHAMIAGYVAGSTGTIVGYPLDSLKVWVQTNTMGKNKHLNKHLGSNSKSNSNSKGPRKGPKDTSTARSSGSCGKSRSSGSTTNNTNANAISKSAKVTYSARRSNSTTAVPTINTIQQRATGAAARIITKPASTVVRTVRALYSGVTGPLATVGMVQSVNFATYDATRRFLYRRQHQHQGTYNCNANDREYLTRDSLGNVAVSGSIAGMVTAVLAAPLLMMKINQQITGNSFRKAFREIFVVESSSLSSSSSSSGRRHYRFRPLRPYGSAFLPHVLSESLGRAIYVTAYEGLKRSLLASKQTSPSSVDDEDFDSNYKYNSNSNNRDDDGNSNNNNNSISLSLRERMACAAATGIISWGIFFPLDALRNRMYHAASRQLKPNNAAAMMTTNSNTKTKHSILETIRIMRKERAFYRGFSISILRAGPVAASVLPVYDLTLEWLSSSK